LGTLGESRSQTSVSAPSAGLRRNGLAILIAARASTPLLVAKPVATTPGGKQLALRPVPSRRCANSIVKRMLASFVWP
jgi:hypothetical protein